MTATAAPRLRILDGPQAGRVVPCAQPRMVIGRGSTVEVVLADDGASRAHAAVAWDGHSWRLEDLGSRNGTRLNGSRVKGSSVLQHGDRLKVGTTELAFENALTAVPEAQPEPVAGCRLLERIGAGCLTETWRAQHQDGSTRAVRLLATALAADAEATAGLLAGAHAQARISHPQVVRVYATVSEPLPAVVLAWATGGSLAARLASRGALPPAEVLELARQAATALQAVCGMGLPHPGLHPGNILFDQDGQLLLSDWSLAPEAQRGRHAPYLAPEEVTGAPPDAAIDQCRLGLVLWQALSGAAPFAGGSPAGDAGVIARARLTNRLDMPACAGAPPGLPRLLARMLARDPRHRYETWSELREVIDLVVGGSELPPLYEESLLRLPGGETARLVRRKPKPAPEPPPQVSGSDARATERLRAGSSVRRVSRAGRPRRRGLSWSSWISAIGVVVVLLVVAYAAHLASRHEIAHAARAVAAATSPSPVTAPSAAAATAVTGPSAGAAGAGVAAPAPAPAPAAPAPAAPAPAAPAPTVDSALPPELPAMPALHPRVVLASWLGGSGDQAISDLAFSSDGHLTATGDRFSALINPADGTAFIHGDASTPSPLCHHAPRLPAGVHDGTLALGGDCTITLGNGSEGGVVVPKLAGASWTWWSLDTRGIASAGLVCDSPLLAVFARPAQRFLLAAWADAANTCLARDPLDLGRPLPFLTKPPAGRATWAILGDGQHGTVIAARALPMGALAAASDPWGRLYLASASAGSDDLGLDGQAGLTVLSPDFDQVLLDCRLGGLAAGEAGWEAFTCIAYHDGWLALGGSTAAHHLATTNPLQKEAGGGQDGLVVVLRLWDEAPASR